MERVVSLKQNVGIIFQQIANDETCVARFCTCVKDIFNWISTPDEAKPVFVWLDRYQTELLLAWDPVTIKPGMEVIYPGLRLLEYLFFFDDGKFLFQKFWRVSAEFQGYGKNAVCFAIFMLNQQHSKCSCLLER